jgi:hypothetical protein
MRTLLIVLACLAMIVLFPPIGILAVLIWLIVAVANQKKK